MHHILQVKLPKEPGIFSFSDTGISRRTSPFMKNRADNALWILMEESVPVAGIVPYLLPEQNGHSFCPCRNLPVDAIRVVPIVVIPLDKQVASRVINSKVP